ncbi:hypothetical protein TSUD_365170 [Trifolium subterraneum]|uniref:Uncharacterized protein n=1 Tax=Trifolium subterraneum TaxID=3900 RepID=A0A2Z6N0R6_TRISU|nr:hypothetical protein TSUD_365170 [Trifolium subterraneum]
MESTKQVVLGVIAGVVVVAHFTMMNYIKRKFANLEKAIKDRLLELVAGDDEALRDAL